MKLEHRLRRWQEAGLLDEPACARILEHERQRPTRPIILYALGGLGALSIGIGLISIIAANWDEISPGVKLGLDLALLLALSVSIFLADARAGLAREVLIFIYYGAALASIGLVAQIYQMGGELRHALLLWSAVTLPILSFAKSRLLMGVWLIALQTTWLMNAFAWANDRGYRGDVLLASAAALLPLLLFGLALVPGLRLRRPQLAGVALGLGGLEWLALLTAAQFAWYDSIRPRGAGETILLCLLGLLALAVFVSAFLPRSLDPSGRRGIQVLLVGGTACGFLPLLIRHNEAGLAGAAGFLLLWGVVGWTALRLRLFWLFNLATALLALRLLGIYFEVFGSLLNTGLGLFSGGALTLVLAWIWHRKTRQVRRAATSAEAEAKNER